MPRGVSAQFGLLAVPYTQRFSALRLLLPKGVAEHVEKIIGIGSAQAIEKFIAILDEFGITTVTIRIQRYPVQLKGFYFALRAILFFGRLYGNQGFGLKIGARNFAGHFVCSGGKYL